MYKYNLTNKRRSDCPFCSKHGKYSAYMNTQTGELAPVEYGMCSSCRKFKTPPNNYIIGETISEVNDEIAYYEADKVNINLLHFYFTLTGTILNKFIEGLEIKFGIEQTKKVVDLYKLQVFENDGIIFPYCYTDNHLCTAKIMFFDGNLHRIKEGAKAFPKFLHNLIYTNESGMHYDFNRYDTDNKIIPFKLKLCLFAHNQIINNKIKTICLVESEKTAVIMSIVMPEFIWVSSGGKTLIQSYKFLFFSGRKCLVFPDLSADDNVYKYWSEKLTYYNRKYGYDFEILDYYSDFLNNNSERINYCKGLKLDIADFVMDFNRKNIYVDYLRNKLINKSQ